MYDRKKQFKLQVYTYVIINPIIYSLRLDNGQKIMILTVLDAAPTTVRNMSLQEKKRKRRRISSRDRETRETKRSRNRRGESSSRLN
jgi:hypothetical protein